MQTVHAGGLRVIKGEALDSRERNTFLIAEKLDSQILL